MIVEQKYIGVQIEYEVFMIKSIDSIKKCNVWQKKLIKN